MTIGRMIKDAVQSSGTLILFLTEGTSGIQHPSSSLFIRIHFILS
jgi:hypothetical protein